MDKVDETPREHSFSSVVSRDSVRMIFLLAALNDVDVFSADIQNAYLTAPASEKFYNVAGEEFGSDCGRPAKVVRELYGLQSVGPSFRWHLAKHLERIGFSSTRADPDVWIRPAIKVDGTQYYEYISCYVDGVLARSEQVKSLFDSIGQVFAFKGYRRSPEEIPGS